MNAPSKVILTVVLVLAVILGTVTYVLVAPSWTRSPPSAPHGTAQCASMHTNSTSGNWTTYHQSNVRSGVEPVTNPTALRLLWAAGPTAVDGQVYAEPLACGDSIYVATEHDSVYALNASNGAVLWRTHLGDPMPGASLPCGNIDPSGITGTPVIDETARTLYVVAFVTPGQHLLFGLDVGNGSIKSRVVVDPAGADPLVEQQRGALTLANGLVYVVYGGLFGDCGNYHGWVVGVPTGGSGAPVEYQVPSHREAGIWGPAGASVAPDGNLYVATGNGDSSATFDHGVSVIELSASLAELGYFAPTDWAQLNAADTDLGSVAPTILPNGNLFQIGKAGVGYLLSGTNLGGVGGQIANASVCAGAYGGTAHVGFSVFVPCTDGIVDVVVGASSLSVAWRTSSFDAGSPIVTGNVVWAVNLSASDLMGFNASTGQALYSFSLGSSDHFISPTATPGRLFVGAGSQLFGFALS